MRRSFPTPVLMALLAGCSADIGEPTSLDDPDAAASGGADASSDVGTPSTDAVTGGRDARSSVDAVGVQDGTSGIDAEARPDAMSEPDAGGQSDAGGGASAPFVEQDGYVVMEMESASIPNGHEWVMQTDLAGYTGTGYYRFVGNGICNGPANSPLEYEFEVGRGATYRLHLRAARYWHCVQGQPHNNNRCDEHDRTCNSLGIPDGNDCSEPDQCIRTDISNDAFVHIEDALGEYVRFDGQPGNSTGNGIKLFGGGNDSWSWTGKNALDTNGKKWAAEWSLSPGRYTLVIEGRSKDFRIDRVLLFDVQTGSTNGAHEMAETRP